MRIVHACLSSNFFCEDFAYQDNLLPKYHSKLGHEVYIIATTDVRPDEKGNIISTIAGEKIINDGIKLIRLKPVFSTAVNQHIHAFYNFGKTIERLEPDLIFAHSLCPNYRFLRKYFQRHPDVKIVYDSHADFNNSCQNKLSYFYSRYIVRNIIAKPCIRTSEHFYGVTPARCDFLHDVYGVPKQKISFLPMGADDDAMRFDRKATIRQQVRNRYGISDDDFLIVTGGKIDKLKNIHVLASAVSQSKFSKIKILIFGSIQDNLKETFEKLKSDRVQCIGWVKSNDVYKYFYAADLVMFPGLHSVLWEQAVASQVPCAFSHIKGFEHVDIGGNCILMEGKTADYYQTLIEKIYQDKDFYQTLCNNAQSEKSKQFLYSHIAQQVIDDVSGRRRR